MNDTVEIQTVNIKTPNHAELCIIIVYRPPSLSTTVLYHILNKLLHFFTAFGKLSKK